MNGPSTFTEVSDEIKLSRRSLLKIGMGAATSIAGLAGGAYALTHTLFKEPRSIPGRIEGAPHHIGHMLRGGKGFPPPSRFESADVVVVGGGIAGLSAARSLHRSGVENVRILELDERIGGNSTGGENEVSAYPWGAHYVPLPGTDAHEVRKFFEELGIITGYGSNGRPNYNEYYLCADPDERLLMYGRWQEGTIPHTGLTVTDREQIHRFFELMEEYRRARGNDGKRAFTIPLDRSSQDSRYTRLDQVLFTTFLAERGFDSKPLFWYLDYCTRDDYGTDLKTVSAWAGIHYFASRDGLAANADADTVITWPQGNNWLVERMGEELKDRWSTGFLVVNVEEKEGTVFVDAFEVATQSIVRWQAKAVVMATPMFVTARIFKGWRERPPSYLRALSYAPWLVANLTLTKKPGGQGAPLSWDNVSYHSDSLGYIHAKHQSLSRKEGKTVISYYRPLSHGDPKEIRKWALERKFEDWRDEIVQDLKRMHSGIEDTIERVDVRIWGHAMARPVESLLWHSERVESRRPIGRVSFANADLSGLSIFEEAFTHGVRAAKEVSKWVTVGRNHPL